MTQQRRSSDKHDMYQLHLNSEDVNFAILYEQMLNLRQF